MLLDWGNVLVFNDEREYYETLGFLCKEEELVRVYIEHNKEAGAWGNQGRMLVRVGNIHGLPRPLEDAFATSKDGRISETKYVTNLQENHSFSHEVDPTGNDFTKYIYKSSLDDVRASVPDEYLADFGRGYHWSCDLMMHIRESRADGVNYENESVQESTAEHPEGRKIGYYTTRYERDNKNRIAAIRIHGTRCMICGFDYEEVYGELGKGYIEVHHIKPLSSQDEEVQVNPETDLICVCANCHRMLHRFKNYIILAEELKQIVGKTV